MPPRKIPTKKELLHLQKIYRTDKRIGQALGDVSEQLVAYWRRKKGIGRSSFPKYTLAEIKELWERYGDDYKAGQQLGITKQAFYRWRKNYKLLDRPAILKLEQLELKFYDEHRLNRRGEKEAPASTVLQKIISYHSSQPFVPLNESVATPVGLALRIDEQGIRVLENDNSRRKSARSAVNRQRFDSILDMIESGYFIPGQVILSNRLEAAAMAVTASYAAIRPELQLQLHNAPTKVDITLHPSLRVTVSGSATLRRTTFDIACQIVAALGDAPTRDFLLELSGVAIERLTLEDRVALLSYLALLATSDVFIEPDQAFLAQLQRLGETVAPVPFSDKNSHCLDRMELLLHRNRPQFYSIGESTFLHSYSAVSRKNLKRVRIGPFVGGTLENIKTLAMSLKGSKIRDGLEVYLVPMTRKIFVDATKKRYTQHLIDAGVRIGNVCSCPSLPPLEPQEYELTTEIDASDGMTLLSSISTITQAVRAGKVTKRIFESA